MSPTSAGVKTCGQSLYTFLRELRTKLDSRDQMQVYYGVVQDLACQGFKVLRHMHKHMVHHLDLKADNILVNLNSDNQLHLMLADFGSSLIGDQLLSFNMQLTPEYWAPELWERIALHFQSETDYLRLQKEQFPPQASFDTYAMGLTIKAQLMTQHADRIAGWAGEGPFYHSEPLP